MLPASFLTLSLSLLKILTAIIAKSYKLTTLSEQNYF